VTGSGAIYYRRRETPMDTRYKVILANGYEELESLLNTTDREQTLIHLVVDAGETYTYYTAVLERKEER
jgi:hypothetical protein